MRDAIGGIAILIVVCGIIAFILVQVTLIRPLKINASATENRRLSLIYYAVVVPVLIILMFAFRHTGGMCNPGIDLICFIVAGISTISLLGKNAYLTYKDRRNKSSLIIHCIAFIGWILLCFYN